CYRFVFAIVLSAALICVSSRPTQASSEVPFHATFETQFDSQVEFPIVHVNVIGHGQATQFGTTQAVTTNQEVNLVSGESSATYTLTAANGDSVEVELDFIATVSNTGITF